MRIATTVFRKHFAVDDGANDEIRAVLEVRWYDKGVARIVRKTGATVKHFLTGRSPMGDAP